MSDTVVFFNHKVGDGVHYITNKPVALAGGKHLAGATSEVCILFNLDMVAARYNLPTVDDMWNMVYPEDFMAVEDIAYITDTAFDFTDEFDPSSPEEVAAALQDTRAMGCDELAGYIEQLLRERGVAF